MIKPIFYLISHYKKEKKLKTTYKSSGVNIDKGEELVQRIKKNVRSTFTKNVLKDIGHFGAFYKADFKKFKNPILVSSVDGVGTKLKIALIQKKYDSIGEDLVNHCVNDIAVCGATPLFFLDYFATGKLNPTIAEKVINGFAKACKENNCSIIGGETAEMPGFYSGEDFDIAGTIVGVVDKNKIVDGKKIKKGNILIGLPSNGLHTNGYSLARKVLVNKISLNKKFSELNNSLGDELLKVHKSYLKQIKILTNKNLANGFSHITGGGLVGNTMRIIPKNLKLKIDWLAWQRPFIFDLIQTVGQVPEHEMARAFNLGIGLVIVASKNNASKILNLLKKENPIVIGEVV